MYSCVSSRLVHIGTSIITCNSQILSQHLPCTHEMSLSFRRNTLGWHHATFSFFYLHRRVKAHSIHSRCWSSFLFSIIITIAIVIIINIIINPNLLFCYYFSNSTWTVISIDNYIWSDVSYRLLNFIQLSQICENFN